MLPVQVLIISNPDDEHTKQVASFITHLGGKPILFYPEQLGTDLFISLYQDINEFDPHNVFSINGDIEINCDDIYSIWYRRPRLTSLNGVSLSQEGTSFVQDEWRAALSGAYGLMNDRFWVSHPDCLETASRKPLQLKLAAELGLKIPRTVITNKPLVAREFFEACGGRVIVKATGRGWVYGQDNLDTYFVMTNRLNAADLQSDNEIRLAPVTFQEEIQKQYEIRVNIVGQKVLAIKIDSQSSPISELDWRRYDVKNTPYTAYQLPFDIEEKCLKLTQTLGLEFGAIDLIRQPDGQYVFLEINGNGQFLWAEELSGVKVSQSLASLLVGASAPLKQYSAVSRRNE